MGENFASNQKPLPGVLEAFGGRMQTKGSKGNFYLTNLLRNRLWKSFRTVSLMKRFLF